MMASYDAKNPSAMQRLIGEKGVTMRPFSDEIMNRARAITFDLLSAEAASDPAYRKLYESYDAWRRASNSWLKTAENTYSSFAFHEG